MTENNRFREFVDARLQPQYLFFIAGTAVTLTLIIAFAQFATANRGQALLATNLGGDFSGFFVAAQILDRGQPEQLYDRQLHHRLWHELLPHEAEQTTIPYIHPPFVAGLLRPLTWVSYPTAVFIWLVISASLYVISMAVLLRDCPWPERNQRLLILLLALSFEPFAFECWLGGQLSSVAFFSYSLCLAAMDRSKPILAGVALGVCFYKPTLLILTLPMLVIGKRWKMLLGMSVTGFALAGLSVAFVGWDVSLSYLRELLQFRKNTAGGQLEIPVWKYVDLNNSLRLLLGPNSQLQLPLLALAGLCPFILLARIWWRSDQFDDKSQRLMWAMTVTWVPVLNLYVGIYDSILIVQSLLLTATLIQRRRQTLTPLTSSGLAYLALGIYVAPWFSQNLAAMTGISIYTVLLISFGIYQFREFYASGSRKSLSANAIGDSPPVG